MLKVSFTLDYSWVFTDKDYENVRETRLSLALLNYSGKTSRGLLLPSLEGPTTPRASITSIRRAARV